jgi:aspartyl aminopeptidase
MSECLSADVNAGFDPNFGGVYEARNSAFVNKGVCVTKFTGGGGKGSTNDAHAEYVNYVRRLFDKENVIWQMGELGKVDQGGGGTVAMILAKLNIDVIDVGVPVLSMHAPVEVISKIDLYYLYLGYKAFIENIG